ncbi:MULTISPECIES: PAS domain-containing protein [unclassified Pseudodesulfovibrio]|uniref:PAS domain-containing protein n=1 Tax=unclassified Pseudodesulfovibrio TaxID=2661612 RepID=UPI000FEBB03F|nr:MULTISPECIES: PAS domain-containing protein [unclassified Pseudodesulfovibrio]MCJ2164806.1 PAS domain-containing protein [Pseudodesulfovibrio sp. S3-i]RWU03822.1 PAS domain S-box protein [Pseudodesulfovibrio sp. S3]
MFKRFRESLIAKMILSGGVTLLFCIFLWSGFNVYYFKRNVLSNVMSDIEMISDTIMLALHYAMMLDNEEDIKENINNISKQEEIESIRVYNKQGRIVFSNIPEEIGTVIGLESPSCWNCHQYDPPPPTMPLSKRTRMVESGKRQLMAIMTPIANTEGCSPGPCHVHKEDEQVLGLLDVTVNMDAKNSMIMLFERANMGISIVVFAATFLALFAFTYKFIFRPIKRLISATEGISAGRTFSDIRIEQVDEIGTLGQAFNMMGQRVHEKHHELMEQREEFRNLFENVPCLVSVVDTDYRVIRHNSAYERHFGLPMGKRCWQVNKGRIEKCEVCPVDRTFKDGLSHMSEESGLSKEGMPIHWIVYTSPVKNKDGRVVAAMEMMIDITRRKELVNQLAASEHRYHAIFDSIPNAVFVLDRDTLEILNSNESSHDIYGWHHLELRGRSFMQFFREEEALDWEEAVRTRPEIELCTHVTKSGRPIFVFLRISPARFEDRDTLIVTCTDVSRKIEAERQLIQASKMTTLGEMSTGVAHELNQPLTILKAISNLLSRKVETNAPLDPEIMAEMAEGISTHVDRASKIIEHMREFGRKSDLKTMPVQINEVLARGFEFFSQQLIVHNIEMIWELEEGLPLIMADSNRLEQVVINLLLNARDAIEEKWSKHKLDADKRIKITSFSSKGMVVFRICDTGAGIPPSIRERLFEPFFTTKNVGKGTGLGLSISYGIVTDYGGDIKAQSWESEGACFEISFPKAECEL